MSQRHSPRPPSVRSLAEYQFGSFLGRDPMTESWEARTADGTSWLVRLVYGVSDKVLNDARARLTGKKHAQVQFPRILSAGPACVAVVAEQVTDSVQDRQLEWKKHGRPAPVEEIVAWLGEAASALDELGQWQLPHLGLHARCLGLSKGRVCILETGLVGLLQLPAGKGAGPLACRFAAPELLTKPSPACDVYSLAAIARHLVGGAGHEPKKWQSALLKALLPEPERRFRTCAELVAELKGTPVAVRPSGTRPAVAAEPVAIAVPTGGECGTVAAVTPPAPAADIALSTGSAEQAIQAGHSSPAAPAVVEVDEADDGGDVQLGGLPAVSADDSQVLLGELPFSILQDDVDGLTGPELSASDGQSAVPAETSAPAAVDSVVVESPEEHRELVDVEPSQEVHPADPDAVAAEAPLADAASTEEAGEEDAVDRANELMGGEEAEDPQSHAENDPAAEWLEERSEIDFPPSEEEEGYGGGWASLAGKWPAVQSVDTSSPQSDRHGVQAAELATVAAVGGVSAESSPLWDCVTAQLETPPESEESGLETPGEAAGTLLSVSLSTSSPQVSADEVAGPPDSPSAHLKRLRIENLAPLEPFAPPSHEVQQVEPRPTVETEAPTVDPLVVDMDMCATSFIPATRTGSFLEHSTFPDDDQPIDIDFGATRVIAPEAFSTPREILQGYIPSHQSGEGPVAPPFPGDEQTFQGESAPAAPPTDPQPFVDALDLPIDIEGGATRVIPERPDPVPMIAPPDARQLSRVVPTLPSRKARKRKKPNKGAKQEAQPVAGNSPVPEDLRDSGGEIPPSAEQNRDDDTYSNAGYAGEVPPPARPSNGVSPVVLSEALRAHVAQVRAALFTDSSFARAAQQAGEEVPARSAATSEPLAAPQQEARVRAGNGAGGSDLTTTEWAPVSLTMAMPASAAADALPEEIVGTSPVVESMPQADTAAKADDQSTEAASGPDEDLSLTRTQNSVPMMTETLRARKVRSARIRARIVRDGRPDAGLSNATMPYLPGNSPTMPKAGAPDAANDPWLTTSEQGRLEPTDGNGTGSLAQPSAPSGFEPIPHSFSWDAQTANRETQGETKQSGDPGATDWNPLGAATAPATWSWSQAAETSGAGSDNYVTPPWEEVLAGQALPVMRSTAPGAPDPLTDPSEMPEDPATDREALARALAAQVVANMMETAQQTDALDNKTDPWQAWTGDESSGDKASEVVDAARFEPSPGLVRLLESAARLMPEPEPEVWTTLPDGRKQLACNFPSSLPPNVSAAAFDGFRRQWNAELKSSDNSGVVFYIGPSAGFWQRWLGRSTGLLVEIRWQRAPEAPLPCVNVQLRAAGRSPDHTLDELGPLVMDSLRVMLLGPSNRRSERRLIWPHPVQLTFLLSSGEVSGVQEGLGKDVSRIGAGIYLQRILPGSQVQVQFNNPDDGAPVRVLSRFIRVNRYGQDWFEVAALFERNVDNDQPEAAAIASEEPAAQASRE